MARVNSSFVKKYIVFTVVIVLLSIFGCSSMMMDPPNANQFTDEQLSAFKTDLQHVVNESRKDKDYKRIPLDSSEDQKWFLKIALEYWAGIIDKATFVTEGKARFPGFEKSFIFVADNLKQ
jgi:hypothetical protein